VTLSRSTARVPLLVRAHAVLCLCSHSLHRIDWAPARRSTAVVPLAEEADDSPRAAVPNAKLAQAVRVTKMVSNRATQVLSG